jgi:hypothetical protein
MKLSVGLGYIFGRGDAIRSAAESQGTFWVGIVLVLLTSIPRNYDQTFILEKPFLWLFGSLLFSLVSGTWLYCVLYGSLVQRAAVDADGNKPPFWGRWRSFMGLFWMTAPVAWLYAIPVERISDSLIATKANLTLLGIVSLWRVVLMARVVQCLTGIRYAVVLLWVLFAAAMEILVVFFFGGAFARAIMSGMGGMRNSPEETMMVGALASVFVVSFWGAPVILILALIFGRSARGGDLPAPTRSPSSYRWLGIVAIAWLAVAVLPQIELSRNVQVEKLMAAQKYREALDYMGARQPPDFAPGRVLAPNAYEWEVFINLPACVGVVQTNDPAWVRQHLMHRLDQMLSHYAPGRKREQSLASYPYDEQVDHVRHGLGRYGPDATGISQLLDGLERLPEGKRWLSANSGFVAGVCEAIREDRLGKARRGESLVASSDDLLTLSNRLDSLLGTNANAKVSSP